MRKETLHYKFAILLLGCVFILFAVISCNKPPASKPDHPALMARFNDTLTYSMVKIGLKAAINHFEKQYSTIKNPGLGDQINYYKSKRDAYLWYNHWDYTKMSAAINLAYPDSIIQLIEKNNAQKRYERDYADAIFSKGDIYYYQLHKYGTALTYYFKGKTIVNELPDDCDKADFTKRFARVDYREGKYRQAASLFMQEFVQRKDCSLNYENFGFTEQAIDEAGLSYSQLGMIDSAIYCFNTNLAYVDKLAHLFPLHQRFILDVHGVTNGDLGFAYFNKGENKKAEKLFKLSINLTSHGGNEAKFGQIMQLHLANLYLTTGHIKQADSTIREIKQSLDTLPNDYIALNLEKLKVDYYNFLNKPKQAWLYLQTYNQLKQKEDLTKHQMVETDVENYFYTIQKNYDKAIINKERQLRILLIIIFIGFTTFISLIAFQFWNNWHTARKNNTALQRTLISLEQSQEENTRLLQVVAHDLRSPISSMFSLASMLLNNRGTTSEQRTVLELIKTSGKNCMDLVNDLLSTNDGVSKLRKEQVDLAQMLTYCVGHLSNKAEEKGQEIVLQTQVSSVPGNPEKLWRVLSNLIGNAIKFSEQGAMINVTLENKVKSALITVKDQGIGIPDALKEKIFHMNPSAMRSGTAGEQSFGMGLAISKQIVDAHGGKLWFESEPGKGTAFYVELLLADN